MQKYFIITYGKGIDIQLDQLELLIDSIRKYEPDAQIRVVWYGLDNSSCEMLKHRRVTEKQVDKPVQVAQVDSSKSIKELPINLESNFELEKAIQYWYYNNIKAEELCSYTYRVEDIYNEFVEVGRLIGKTLNSKVLTEIPNNTNAYYLQTRYKEVPEVTWKEVEKVTPELYQEVRQPAEKYGYSYE